ncbi:hypothetical protein J4E93_008228 [Alternaria ventricosa]|uniref:uncharacterized protein n=1 Tax=Alternaria ventricosa TaxID=1187951 RepID=UPI0020C437AD|nr:uncharacterized protein J4E93_008228 [Alternaria ventricosa]KAI4640638.1 hypothetical protein J4E93_008228 [Alternaria ventricosa]
MSNNMDFDFSAFCNDDFLKDIPLPSVETSGDDVALNFDYGFNAGEFAADMSFGPAGGDFLGEVRHIQDADSSTCALRRATENLAASSLPAAPGPIEAMWAPLMNPAPPVTPAKKTKAPAKPRETKPKAPPKPKVVKVKAPPKPRAPKAPKEKAAKVTKPKKPAKAHKRTVSAPSGPVRCVGELYHLPWSQLSQEEKGRLLLPLLQGIDPSTGIKIGEPGALLPPPDFEMIGEDVFGTGDSGAKLMGTSTSSPETQRNSLTITPSSPTAFLSSPATAITTRDSDAEDAAKYRALMAAQKAQMSTTSSPMSNSNVNNVDINNFDINNVGTNNVDINNTYQSLGNDAVNMDYCLNKDTSSFASDFQFDIPDFTLDMPEFEFNLGDVSHPAHQGFNSGRGLGGPCGNGVIGDPAPAVQSVSPVTNNTDFSDAAAMLNARRGIGQTPTPASDYGRLRQMEALKRNAELQAAGRRR